MRYSPKRLALLKRTSVCSSRSEKKAEISRELALAGGVQSKEDARTLTSLRAAAPAWPGAGTAGGAHYLIMRILRLTQRARSIFRRCVMAVERSPSAAENLGSLRGCLVEGDPEQRKRERSVRRRALLVSVLLQCTALVGLVLIPLFAQQDGMVFAIATPIPPYHHVAAQAASTARQPADVRRICVVCFNSKP